MFSTLEKKVIRTLSDERRIRRELRQSLLEKMKTSDPLEIESIEFLLRRL